MRSALRRRRGLADCGYGSSRGGARPALVVLWSHSPGWERLHGTVLDVVELVDVLVEPRRRRATPIAPAAFGSCHRTRRRVPRRGTDGRQHVGHGRRRWLDRALVLSVRPSLGARPGRVELLLGFHEAGRVDGHVVFRSSGLALELALGFLRCRLIFAAVQRAAGRLQRWHRRRAALSLLERQLRVMGSPSRSTTACLSHLSGTQGKTFLPRGTRRRPAVP